MAITKTMPPYLKQGDEVAIISPAYAIDGEKLPGAVGLLEKWGLKVLTGKNILKRDGPFAGTDIQRLEDLQEMTDNSMIKAVFCSRGGYGMSRIITKADFSALAINPKWYVGFSDITVLHLWLSEIYGMVSLHAEMPLNYSSAEKSPETFSTLKSALFGGYRECSWDGASIRTRPAKGEVTGGNISLVYSLLGTAAEPDTDGKILFLEDTGEYLYHLDRMLMSLKMAGKLSNLSALIAGGLNDMQDGKTKWGFTAEETIAGMVSEYDYPVYFNFPAGHVSDNRAIYIGRNAVIESSGKSHKLVFN